jgi:hypothetical protein
VTKTRSTAEIAEKAVSKAARNIMYEEDDATESGIMPSQNPYYFAKLAATYAIAEYQKDLAAQVGSEVEQAQRREFRDHGTKELPDA